MATVHQLSPSSGTAQGRKVLFVKGAPDRLLPMCAGQLTGDDVGQIAAYSSADLAPLDGEFWRQKQEELSSQGLRVLALCR